MGNKGSSFGLSGLGMVGVLIALAIVLLLAARQWQSMAPTILDMESASATDFQDELQATGSDTDHPSPGHLPNLREMRSATAEHQQDVDEARRQIDAAHRPGTDQN